MSVASNVQHLIDYVESLPNIEDRYEDLKCISVTPNNQKRGALSVVFSATDTLEDENVVIKVMDPNFLGDPYRVNAFDREPKVLERLFNKKRCLTILFRSSSFTWDVELLPGQMLSLPMKYFVTDFIDHDIDKFFLDQSKCSTLDKLIIFRGAVLAVNSAHSAGVSHRDLKCDNLRARTNLNPKPDIVAIDFGTAVHVDDPILLHPTHYPKTVGATEYSSPEAQCGLKSYRKLGHLNDIYALGALLYQMFNSDLFYHALNFKTPNYCAIRSHMMSKLATTNNDVDKEAMWRAEMPSLRLSVLPPSIEQRGNTIPRSIVNILVTLHRSMTMFDFDQRVQSLEPVLRDVDRAIRVLENVRLDQKRAELRKQRKERREKKLKYRDDKLKEYLQKNLKAVIN